MKFYNLNGIITDKLPESNYWFEEFNNEFFLNKNDITFDIESTCVLLNNLLIKKIFGNYDNYFSILHLIPHWIPFGGIDSDIKVSKEEFESLVKMQTEKELMNKLLYFYDCRNLISTIQNSVIETKYLLGQFYKILNEESFLIKEQPAIPEGVHFASGTIVTNIISITNYLFINLYSQLDFVTKLAYEFENIVTEFDQYPNMRSSKILFGDKKKLAINASTDSLFNTSPLIQQIINIRNEIIHNSSIDNMPKVFQVIKDNIIVEKFIFLPDFKDGNIKTYKNRKRFYYDEVKLNEVLPDLLVEFWNRLNATLKLLDK